MKLRARDFAALELGVDVTVEADSDIFAERLDCECCGRILPSEVWDPPGQRGFTVSWSSVSVEVWELDDPHTPEIYTGRYCEECASDFEDAVELHRAATKAAVKEAA